MRGATATTHDGNDRLADAGTEGASAVPAPDAGAPASEGGTPRRGIGTRRRLLLSFAALAAAFTAAFGSLLVGLDRMEERLQYLHEHEGQMRVVLDLGEAIRRRYSEASLPPNGEASTDARPLTTEEQIHGLLARLVAEVDEPDPMLWVADTAAAVRRLEELSGASPAPGAPVDAAAALLRRGESVALVFRVEGNLDRLFAFLRDAVARESGAVGALRTRTLHLAIAFVLGTLVLAGVLVLHLSRSIAGPLAVLGAGAARVARGDLDTRIALRSGDEFGALAAEFNAMAASLQQHQERLVRSEKLAGLGRVAAGIAHELNNPLQVMLGYLSLDRDLVGGQVAGHLARIEREARRCQEIVDALLQLARPSVAFVPEPVDLRDVSEEVAEAIRVALGARAPDITVVGAATALGSRSRIRQILVNLARNGADAAGPDGAVRIDLFREEHTARIVVSDTGPGVPPALRGRIFEPFFTTKPDGTGLGLAIARAIAVSLGGDVELERADAPGTRFALRVPARLY